MVDIICASLTTKLIKLRSRSRYRSLKDSLDVDREFLPDGEFTVLQAVDHLGEERVKVAIAVERALILDHDDEHE